MVIQQTAVATPLHYLDLNGCSTTTASKSSWLTKHGLCCLTNSLYGKESTDFTKCTALDHNVRIWVNVCLVFESVFFNSKFAK